MKLYIVLFLSFFLFACNSEDSGLPRQFNENNPPGSFNFHEILSVNDDVKTYLFEWDDSMNSSYYTLCEKNRDYTNDCNVIKDKVIGNSVTYELPSLLTPEFLNKEFFVIAHNKNSMKLSHVRGVTEDEYLKSIGSINSLNHSDNDRFGKSVSFNDNADILVVGAFGVHNSAGKSYVFYKKGQRWEQIYELAPNDLVDGSRFGIDSAISKNGNTLVIGADNYASGMGGKAYVYNNIGNAWVLSEIFTKNISNDMFGNKVSVSDDGLTIIVASPSYEIHDNGSVYIYTNKNGTWLEKKLIASFADTYGPNRFGSSISLNSNGDILAVGALGESEVGKSNEGSVYIFKKTSLGWEQKNRFQSSIVSTNQWFGKSVSLDNTGTVLAVGAPEEDSSGSVYLFREENDTWLQIEKIQPTNLKKEDRFGYKVELSGNANNLVIGAFTDNSGDIFIDDNVIENSGAVYLYKKENSLWKFDSYIKSPKNQMNGHFGMGFDINDDGSQMVVGARQEFNLEGRVYLY